MKRTPFFSFRFVDWLFVDVIILIHVRPIQPKVHRIEWENEIRNDCLLFLWLIYSIDFFRWYDVTSAHNNKQSKQNGELGQTEEKNSIYRSKLDSLIIHYEEITNPKIIIDIDSICKQWTFPTNYSKSIRFFFFFLN